MSIKFFSFERSDVILRKVMHQFVRCAGEKIGEGIVKIVKCVNDN